jgi:hypothetical protein
MRVAVERSVTPAQELTGVAIAEDNRAVAHDNRPFRETEIRSEQRWSHRNSPFRRRELRSNFESDAAESCSSETGKLASCAQRESIAPSRRPDAHVF